MQSEKIGQTPVRVATINDEPEILRLLHMMHGEGGLLSLDIDASREMFNRAFQKKGGIIGVIGRENDIHAMIYLLITRFWYTRDNHIEELFNYVRPDHRQSNHARTLIDFAKKCADEIGLPLCIGVLTNRRLEAKVRLYQRLLGFPAGAFFVHGAAWVNERSSNDDTFWKSPFPNRLRKACATSAPPH